MRRGGAAIASSPTMIGALSVLIVVLAVFLAYNANTGLPFTDVYRISVQVPNANTLVPSNEVRIGGVRVGQVESIEPVQHENGSTTAQLNLKLDKEVEPLPKDSTVIVRSRSALGLKVLEINKGDSTEGWPEGAVLPLRKARPEPVEIDEVLNIFDEPTREAARRNLIEFGNALAGRGPDLNAALGELPPLLRRLEAVMRNLGSPATRLARFVRALGAAAAEVAPVAEIQAQMFVSLDTTFGALARVARPFIQEAISKTPPTLDTLTRTAPRIRTFMRHTGALFADLEPGAEALGDTAPELADALIVGVPALREAPALNAQLPPTARALKQFNDDPDVREGIDQLTELSEVLSPTLEFVAPAQSVCNYATLFFRNLASVAALGDRQLGTWQRFILFDIPKGPNSEGSPSSAPADGPDEANFLHVNPYPNTAAPGQTRECEAGNEPYPAGRQVIGNVPGNQGTTTEDQR